MKDDSKTGVSEELYQQAVNFFVQNPDRWIRRSEIQNALGIKKTQACRLLQILSERLALVDKEQKHKNSPLLLKLSSESIRNATKELSSISSLTDEDRKMLSILMDMAESTGLYGDMISNLKSHLAMSRFLQKGIIPVYSYSPDMQTSENSRQFLPDILQAISESKAIWITYKSPWSEQKTYTTNPIGIFSQNGILYLFSYNPYFGHNMVHAFSRIQNVSMAEEAYTPEEYKDLSLIMDPFGIATDDENIEVTVWVEADQAFFEKEALRNEKAEITDNDDGSIIIKIKTRNRYACKRWIMGLGSQARCLEPIYLVEEIKRELISTVNQYELAL